MPIPTDGDYDPSPIDEIDRMDLIVEEAALDEEMTMFDADTHPKPPSPQEEAVTDVDGKAEVDIMRDTPDLDDIDALSEGDDHDIDIEL